MWKIKCKFDLFDVCALLFILMMHSLTECTVCSLVFSQSLISLDLIEDFLELAGRAKEEGKPSPYKGRHLIGTFESLHKASEWMNISEMN